MLVDWLEASFRQGKLASTRGFLLPEDLPEEVTSEEDAGDQYPEVSLQTAPAEAQASGVLDGDIQVKVKVLDK